MTDQTWPAPTPRDEMLARVVTRGRRIQMINRLLVAAAVAAAATVAGLGVWLGASGTISLVGESAGAEAPVLPPGSGTVSYVACPGEQPLGELRSGDRVFLTGRDASGEWIEVRAPEDASIPVWVRAEVVDPDGDADLPEVECSVTEGALPSTSTTAPDEEVAPEETTTTTVAEDEDEGEEPEDGEPTPTTAPTPTPPVTPSTTTPTSSSTTQPTPAPAIGTISRSHTEIWEVDSPGQCQWYGESDVRTTISAPISNATSATLTWSLSGESGSISMQRSGSTFTAVFGDVPHATVPHTPPYRANATLTVRADGPGGTAHKTTTVRVNDCTPG